MTTRAPGGGWRAVPRAPGAVAVSSPHDGRWVVARADPRAPGVAPLPNGVRYGHHGRGEAYREWTPAGGRTLEAPPARDTCRAVGVARTVWRDAPRRNPGTESV
ncbi:hypothetical protein SBRY_30092 [Actinacidiphila bryophytorum]|uniref:Uncharacterized protein n=1 Tax=Actinacidiphila bryophytorum TaxID=1436133 RepID=A0A9W4H0D1_9ACTN|nr:hypothetical protein SBRY_30092 [Actinacidiphila bryophytorum]